VKSCRNDDYDVIVIGASAIGCCCTTIQTIALPFPIPADHDIIAPLKLIDGDAVWDDQPVLNLPPAGSVFGHRWTSDSHVQELFKGGLENEDHSHQSGCRSGNQHHRRIRG
jgi:hypothetical protein